MTSVTPATIAAMSRRDARSASRHTLGLLTLALGLSACALGPDYQTPSLPMPAKYPSAEVNQSAAKPHLTDWWTRLEDPTLNALIDEAILGNLDVETAKARVAQARASYQQSTGALLPTVASTDTISRQKAATAVAGGSGRTFTQFQAGFDASWEIDLFGKNARGAEAAGYGVEAAEEQLRLALLTLVGDVASNYVQARGYQARIALARKAAASQRETAQLTKTRFDAGGTAWVDVATFNGQASTTEASIATLNIRYAESVHRLSVLTGRTPGDLTAPMARVRPLPRPKGAMPVGLPADLLTARPDVRQAERLLAQATARIGQAEAAQYPSVSLTGTIATTGLNVGDLGKASTIGWSFGPSLTVPIFNGGRLRAAVEMEGARRDEAFVAYRASVLKALEDVENALVSTAQERVRQQKLASAVASYDEAATLSRSLYQKGAVSFLVVLDAERSLYSAENALVESRIALATSYVALNKALGGGWNGRASATNKTVSDSIPFRASR